MFREGLRPLNPFAPRDPLAAETQDGSTIRSLASLAPLLLIFLGDDKWMPAIAADWGVTQAVLRERDAANPLRAEISDRHRPRWPLRT